MQADLTRITFDPENDFTRVVQQQGRCEVDADWNEQAAILTHGIRCLARDLIGPHGGPNHHLGFEIVVDPSAYPQHHDHLDLPDEIGDGDFLIMPGIYYVDGIRCRNRGAMLYTEQPGREPERDCCDKKGTYLVYLDVWERHVTSIEEPRTREVALMGPDTCTRLQLVWQVMACDITDHIQKDGGETKHKTKGGKKTKTSATEILIPSSDLLPQDPDKPEDPRVKETAERILRECTHRRTARLSAGLTAEDVADEPCVVPPSARYRGLENQLYRIEIHTGGSLAHNQVPTFKWSRENASVVFPILACTSDGGQVDVELEHLGRDERYTLQPNDLVEVVNDDVVLNGEANALLTVVHVDASTCRVTLAGTTDVVCDPDKHPFLRRWDHRAGSGVELAADGAIPYEEGRPFKIEDGIEITFEQRGACLRAGDYWVIPARTATGDVEWPRRLGGPSFEPPLGIRHHYAPLAYVTFDDEPMVHDLRRRFDWYAK